MALEFQNPSCYPTGHFGHVVASASSAGSNLLLIAHSAPHLNYSKFDSTRLEAFLHHFGFRQVTIANVFSRVTPKSADIKSTDRFQDVVHEGHDMRLRKLIQDHDCILACWGDRGNIHNRHASVVAIASEVGKVLRAFGFSKRGFPRHIRWFLNAKELNTSFPAAQWNSLPIVK